MRRVFSVTLMAAILATMTIVTSVDMISDAEALKSKAPVPANMAQLPKELSVETDYAQK